MKNNEIKIMKRSTFLPQIVHLLHEKKKANLRFFFIACRNYSPNELKVNSNIPVNNENNYASNKSAGFDMNETMYVSEYESTGYKRNPR